MVVLGGLRKFVAVYVFGAVEVQAPLADPLGIQLGNIAIVTKFHETRQVVVVVADGFLRAVLFDLHVLQEVGD